MNFPSKIVENAVNHLSSLPGVGKKTALRLVLHLLKRDKLQVEKFGESFLELVNKIKYCDKCYAISTPISVAYVIILKEIILQFVLSKILEL